VKWNQSGLLFVPSLWQRASVIRWLKRIHAWTGFWGAMLFLMLGISGILLNHRAIWKIETGEPTEVSAMNVAVAPWLIPDEKALGTWAKGEFHLTTDPRAPKKDDKGKKTFLGKVREEAPQWSQQFNQSNGRITVYYVPGSNNVAVRQDATNALGFIKNLHKGTGVGLAWVLFMDSIAGALFAMSVTGFLLWTRLHGGRLIAGGIVFSSVTVGAIAIWPYLL
jgi:uncharacterized protein